MSSLIPLPSTPTIPSVPTVSSLIPNPNVTGTLNSSIPTINSLPQGSEVLNTSYFSSLTDRINACSNGPQLQALTTEAMSSLGGVQSAISTQLSSLAPLLQLLQAPTNPFAVVTWVSNFIQYSLTPQLIPYTNYAIKLGQLSSQISSLTSAITSKAAQLEHSITFPTIKVPTAPAIPPLVVANTAAPLYLTDPGSGQQVIAGGGLSLDN